jgi:hypothetical protein
VVEVDGGVATQPQTPEQLVLRVKATLAETVPVDEIQGMQVAAGVARDRREPLQQHLQLGPQEMVEQVFVPQLQDREFFMLVEAVVLAQKTVLQDQLELVAVVVADQVEFTQLGRQD